MPRSKHLTPLFLACSLALGSLGAHAMVPGDYSAEGHGQNGPVAVTVTVDKDHIKAIRIDRSAETGYIAQKPMQSVIDTILADQTLAVDTVSGATLATSGLLHAVGLALEKAGADTLALSTPPTRPDGAALPVKTLTADVVIVGAGASGLAAAVTAAQNGKRVVVFEKDKVPGGAARLNGPIGEPVSAEAWIKTTRGHHQTNEQIRALCQDIAATRAWLARDMGITKNTTGTALVDALYKKARALGVTFYLDTPVTDLAADEAGRVTGVTADGLKNRYRARAGRVILASGGFAASYTVMASQLPFYTIFVAKSPAPATLTGDALALAEKVGARLDDEHNIIGHDLAPAYEPLRALFTGENAHGNFVLINERGRRFVNEAIPDKIDDVAKNTTVWAVIHTDDEKTRRLVNDYLTWDVAVDGADWAELARRMGLDADAVKKTMSDYHKACNEGIDADFGKPATALKPFKRGPYYAVCLTPSLVGTIGGITAGKNGRVFNADMKPVAGLRAAGELVNAPYYGVQYVPGTALDEALATGRRAALK